VWEEQGRVTSQREKKKKGAGAASTPSLGLKGEKKKMVSTPINTKGKGVGGGERRSAPPQGKGGREEEEPSLFWRNLQGGKSAIAYIRGMKTRKSLGNI